MNVKSIIISDLDDNMPGCSALNCVNSARKGNRVFRFPTDATRKATWVSNMGRANWTPTVNSRLCEVHFEQSQFEQYRLDGHKKLKPNAVPTLFDEPNPPSKINPPPRKSIYKRKVSNVKNPSNSENVTPAVVNKKMQSCQDISNQMQNNEIAEVSDQIPSKNKIDEEISRLKREINLKHDLHVVSSCTIAALIKQNEELKAEVENQRRMLEMRIKCSSCCERQIRKI